MTINKTAKILKGLTEISIKEGKLEVLRNLEYLKDSVNSYIEKHNAGHDYTVSISNLNSEVLNLQETIARLNASKKVMQTIKSIESDKYSSQKTSLHPAVT